MKNLKKNNISMHMYVYVIYMYKCICYMWNQYILDDIPWRNILFTVSWTHIRTLDKAGLLNLRVRTGLRWVERILKGANF